MSKEFCLIILHFAAGLMNWYLLSLLSAPPPPRQLVTATLWAQQARHATRPQASAPARTVSRASHATAAPKGTSRAARPWPPASVSNSDTHPHAATSYCMQH